jgi:hypothetical protein
MKKAKNDNVNAKSSMIEEIINTLLNRSNYQIKNVINKKENE